MVGVRVPQAQGNETDFVKMADSRIAVLSTDIQSNDAAWGDCKRCSCRKVPSGTSSSSAITAPSPRETGPLFESLRADNNDGHPDLFVANEEYSNQLFTNDGSGGFVAATGIIVGDSSSYTNGAAWADYNNECTLAIDATTRFAHTRQRR